MSKKEQPSNIASWTKRFYSFSIDLCVLGFLPMLMDVIFEQINPALNDRIYFSTIATVFTSILLLFRDSIKWLGFGKKIGYLRIVDVKKAEIRDFWKLFLRNLPLIVFPADALCCLVMDRSIGDYLTKTYVVDTRQNKNFLLDRTNEIA